MYLSSCPLAGPATTRAGEGFGRALCESGRMNYPIRLDQYLKVSRLVSSGGEAKLVIGDGMVKVNGQVELRRGRKLHQGDQIQLGDKPVQEA